MLFTLSQVGADVDVTGTGTLNTTALTIVGPSSLPIEINPGYALLAAGAGGGNLTLYRGITTSPARFGSGGATYGAGTGNLVGIYGAFGELYVPVGYVSGTPLADTATFPNATFASLGFTPGTYTFTWGTGVTADSLVVTSGVPEPSTWALLAVGAGAPALAALRRRVRPA